MATICVLIGVLLAPATAVDDQARALYQAGSAAFRKGDYALAVDAFASARRLVRRPSVLFSLAQAHRLKFFLPASAGGGLIGDLEAAVEAYRAAIAAGLDAERRTHATMHLSSLVPYMERSRLGDNGRDPARSAARLIVTSTVEGASARVGARPPQPVPATFEVEPGAHAIVVTAPDHRPAQQSTIAVRGTAVAVALDPQPTPATLRLTIPRGARVQVDDRRVKPRGPLALAPGPHEIIIRAIGHRPHVERIRIGPGEALAVTATLEPTTQRRVSWVLMGLAGALAVGAGTTGLLAHDAQQDAEALRAQVGDGLLVERFDRYGALRDARDGYLDATIAQGAATATALATGLLFYFLDDPEPVRQRPAVAETPSSID